MPVDTTHGLYNSRLEQWTRCRDAYNGSDTVKAKGETHLPKLLQQDDKEYAAYKKRTMWYGATARTVIGLAGAVTRKEAVVTIPEAMSLHLQDVTLTGCPFEVYVKEILTEVLLCGRVGILVDMSAQSTPEATGTTRPYWVSYTAEQIINWKTESIGGVQSLTMVVLAESYDAPGLDEFEVEVGTRYRVLALIDGVYMIRLFTPIKTASGVVTYTEEQIVPVFRGAPLTEIPFCFIGASTLSVIPEKPPLLDLVDVNFSHYLSSADLEHGRHFCGLPTPWVAGFPKDTVLAIGSSVAWVSPDPGATAGMLEFTGQGLGALEKALETKEKIMAVLGARMLEEQKAGVEATDTVTLRTTGERSALQSVAMVVSLGLSKVLKWHAQWMGVAALAALDEIQAQLNSDFVAQPMDSASLSSLVQAWQSNAISYETFYYNLQRGELTRPDIEAEDEQALIDIQAAKNIEEQVRLFRDRTNEEGNEDEETA